MTLITKQTSVRTVAGLVAAALVAALCVLAAAPAHAQKVVGHDAKGDAEFYDVDKVVVNHREERVRVTIEAHDRTPYWYDVFVDTPGGKPWKYAIRWSAYWPHRLWVMNRKQFSTGEGAKCKLWSAREVNIRDVTFSVPVECLNEPGRIRLRAKSFDDETGMQDRTAFTRWAARG